MLISTVSMVIEFVTRMIAGIVQIISGGIETIVGIFQFFNDLVKGNWSKLGNDLVQIGHGMWNGIVGAWQAGIGAVFISVVHFVDNIAHLFTNLADQLVGHSIVPDMVNAIGDWFAKLPGMLGTALARMVPMALDLGGPILGSFIQGLKTEMPTLVMTMFEIAGHVSDPLIALAGQAGGWGLNVLTNFVNGLSSGAGAKLGLAIGKWEDDIIAGIGLIISDAWNQAVDTVGQFIAGLVTATTKITTTILGWASTFRSEVNKIVTTAYTMGRNIVQQLIEGLLSKLSDLRNTIAQIAQTISDHLPHSPAKVGPLSTLNESMPAMIAILKQGILDGRPEIANAMSLLTGQIHLGTPTVGGLALGAQTAGINAASAAGPLGSSRAEDLLARLVAIAEGQANRSQPLGAPPGNAQIGSIVQNNSFNSGSLLGWYNELNTLAGLTFENSLRGAING